MRIASLLARCARSVPAARQKLVLHQSALSLAHATGRSMSSGKRVWNVYLSGEIHRCVCESFPTRAFAGVFGCACTFRRRFSCLPGLC